MKKIFLLSLFLILLGLAPDAFAQSTNPSGFTALAPIPGLTEGVTTDPGGLAAFFNNLYKYLIGLAAALAVIMIIWGGLEISTQDSVSKQSAGRERITQAIFGLVLVLSPVLVFSIINPSILNLSLNLQPLKTKSGAPAQTTGTLPICEASQTTNCTRPVCNSYRKTNCIPPSAATATQEGPYASQPTDMWCYKVKPFTDSGVEYNFICSTQQSICEKDFKLDTQNALGSCTKL